jgi:CheY-specific phosphatase CheX
MNFNPDEMYQIVSTIWEAAIGLQIRPELPAAGETPLRSTAACIQITGAWNGAILLDCPVEVAQLAACSMFNTVPEKVNVADMQDAVAELVNMIGGNFKALLPETCYLSLPSVVEGGDYSTRVPGSAIAGRLGINCQGHAMAITVLEKVSPKADTA